MNIPAGLRAKVVQRAGNRCEYCRLSQKGQEATFHLDHIIPVAAGGQTHLENLALACVSCSLRKGARRSANDPLTGSEALLFHPREQSWDQHFAWRGSRVFGTSSNGRATVDLLKMNRLLAVAIRKEERFHGRHPS
jgi:HNH endonuclease